MPSQMEASSDPSDTPLDADRFDALMAPLGPWPRSPGSGPIAVAVSGGADSTCLALLTAGWAAHRAIPLLALIVDHRLRPDSTQEATETAERLGDAGIPSRILTLHGLSHGPGLAERGRLARYDILIRACREIGAVDLLLGHHAHDQAETVLIRQRAQSGPDGLAGMAPLLERDQVRLLRPLLSVPPEHLRATLRRRGIAWVEDPSNQNPRATRTGVRQELMADPARLQSLLASSQQAGRDRETSRRQDAALLAAQATLRPEGFALLPPDLVAASALAALIRTVGARPHRPPMQAIERLVRSPRPSALAGTRLLPAGRLGPGWLLVREAASLQAPIAATPGACWDDRFVLHGNDAPAPGLWIGPLGPRSPLLRRHSDLPAVILWTLPSLQRADGTLLAVSHLDWREADAPAGLAFRFQPPSPATDSTPFTIA